MPCRLRRQTLARVTGPMRDMGVARGGVGGEWERQLCSPAERTRLVRLCARLTGSYEAAEDLAQETLYEAWRRAPTVRDPEAWRAWLFGIARNVCLRWQRRAGRDAARLVPLLEKDRSDAVVAFDGEALEREELAGLVDRALARLPKDARTVLQERIIEDRPAAEVAATHGLTEGAVGVRLHRAKAAFRQIVQTDLWGEAVTHGLLSGETTGGWQETPVWCPYCGGRKLLGWFDRRPGTRSFKMNCPGCIHPTGRRSIGAAFTSEQHSFDFERVLGEVEMFRPALRRTHAWWAEHFRSLVRRGYGPCAD
jgi:RNA polymerase sigma factor (sigma-70 family)